MSEKAKKEKPKKEKNPKKEKVVKTKVCPACNAEIPRKAKLCPHCAAKQPKKIPMVLIGVAAALLLAVAASVSIFVFHFPVDPPFALPKNYADSPLGQGMELSGKQEEAALEVFGQCGINRIVEVKPLVSDEESSTYAVNDSETVHFSDTQDAIVVELDNETKTINSIDFQKNAVYRNGTVIAQATDFYLTGEQRDVYLDQCLTAVKSRITLPETASFPAKSAWVYEMDGEKVTVKSTVTSKDTTGTPETRYFTAEFENGEFVSVNIGDIVNAAPAETPSDTPADTPLDMPADTDAAE